MSAINWVGKQGDRVGRGSSGVPVCETRWIVPVKPYESPRGSWERIENNILMGAAVLTILFSFAAMLAGAL